MKYFLFSLILFFTFSFTVFSSEIYFEGKNKVEVGETITLPIYLNTLGEEINTIDIEIYFNNEIFTFKGYQENTFKNWIIPPKVEGNKIYLSGIVPGGIKGIYDPNKKGLTPIPVIDLNFVAKKEGQASFIFVKNQVLKNDGVGSDLEITKKDFNIIVTENLLEAKEEFLDNQPPLPFSISIIEDANTGKLLVFEATDKESGIAFYKLRNNFRWENIVSPYKLDKPFFDEIITIRAYDFSNNFTESYIAVDGYFNKYVFYFIVLVLASFFIRKLIK
jgi:hypothetical protein